MKMREEAIKQKFKTWYWLRLWEFSFLVLKILAQGMLVIYVCKGYLAFKTKIKNLAFKICNRSCFRYFLLQYFYFHQVSISPPIFWLWFNKRWDLWIVKSAKARSQLSSLADWSSQLTRHTTHERLQ